MFRSFRSGLRPVKSFRRGHLIAVFAGSLLSFSFGAHSQTPQTARGVIRLKVKYKSGSTTKELSRKRFFLIKGSNEQNAAILEKIKQTAAPSRECYYRARGASEQLIKWLEANDCDSVYCRQIEDTYVSGNEAVPEFKAAYDQALRDLTTPAPATRWLTNYLSPDIRDGYYKARQQTTDGLVKLAETSTGKTPMSIMTDRKGTAYLTDIEPGIYTISNLVAAETDQNTILWICEREVKAADLSLAMRRPFILSNEKDPKVKCEVIERPLPVCAK